MSKTGLFGIVKCHFKVSKIAGALKMREWKMQEWKLQEKTAGVEI